MDEFSGGSPQISDPPSPLDSLIIKALRRYGDFAPETVEGMVALMFIDFANDVIEDLRAHPYWPKDENDIALQLDYYTHHTETRPIPDVIMVAGLGAKYAEQQESVKMRTLMPRYFRIMNGVLWHRLNGNTGLDLQAYDKQNAVATATARDVDTGD